MEFIWSFAGVYDSVQFSSVTELYPTLCDPMDCSMPHLPVYHQLNGHEFEQAPGISDGQGNVACCSPWDRKELDMIKQLN